MKVHNLNKVVRDRWIKYTVDCEIGIEDGN